MAATHFSGPVVSTNGFTAGGGTQITYVQKGTVTVDPASINSAAIGETSVTITGAVAGDTVIMNAPAAIEAGCVWSAFVSATNTVNLRIANLSGGSLDIASATWTYCLIRS